MKKVKLSNLSFSKERIVNFETSLKIKGGTGTGEFTFVYYVETEADAWNQTCHECGFGNNTHRHGAIPGRNIPTLVIENPFDKSLDCRGKGGHGKWYEALGKEFSWEGFC